jgi:1-deoxy-D-xylulose-5-phosphate reductoisomerase
MEAGNGATTVLNAANEVAVAEFMAKRLSFGGIAALVATAMEAASGRGIMREPASVEDAVAVDDVSRSLTLGLLPEIAAKAS